MDSPALNPHSRAVMATLPRPQLPDMPIVVTGPGPREPGAQKRDLPPVSSISKPLPQPEETTDGDDQDYGVGSNHEDISNQPKLDDPYSSLGDAFRDYLTDLPQPIAATIKQRDVDEDLLF